MPFVGGAIMPHGALILDPSRAEMAGEVGAAALRLHAACVAAGSAIAAAKPDVVLLYTPHGLLGEGADMHVYLNATASGTCEWMGAWSEHRASVRCDADAARSLLAHLQRGGHSAAGLTAFSGYDAPLRWGEAVPLSFLSGVANPTKSSARLQRLRDCARGRASKLVQAIEPALLQKHIMAVRLLAGWMNTKGKRSVISDARLPDLP